MWQALHNAFFTLDKTVNESQMSRKANSSGK